MAGIRYKGKIFSGVASVGDADEVAYDNTESGLVATNVQDAVDEVDSKKADTYDWYKSNPDLNVGLITNVQSGDKSQAALQSHDGVNGWRLLMGQDGAVSKYKTTNGGANWSLDKRIEVRRVEVYSADISVGNPTEVSFALPSDYHFSFGVVLYYAWPLETWNNGAVVTIVEDRTIRFNTGTVVLTTNQAQRYNIRLSLLYI